MASQAMLVFLSPTVAPIAAEFGASVGLTAQARSVTAAVAIVASVPIAARIDSFGVPRILGTGAALAVIASAAIAVAPTLGLFIAAHVIAGAGFACLLSAGFAGVAAFAPDRRTWAMGYVAGANALAWILVAPAVGLIADAYSWRVAQAVPGAIAIAALVGAPAASPAAAAPGVIRAHTVLANRSARRWVESELIAYASWTALLTFVGAFFIERLGAGQGATGFLLAAGAAAYFLAATRSGWLAQRAARRALIAGSALAMAVLAVVLLAVSGSIAGGAIVFVLIGLAAGVRTPSSSGLGLDQLPEHPGTMMSVRTGATQFGYLAGAVLGGILIAGTGYAGLGLALAAGMGMSAVLIMRVDDPRESLSGEP